MVRMETTGSTRRWRVKEFDCYDWILIVTIGVIWMLIW